MAITISTAFVEQFTSMVRHLAQQGDARLRPHVTEVASNAEGYNWDRLSSTDAVEKTGDRVSTDLIFRDTPWSRRRSTPSTFHWADTIENADKVQMLIDPQSAYAQNAGMAMRRAIDDLIIGAATAPADDGAGGTTPWPPAPPLDGQVVGGNTQKLNLDFITEVNEIFQKNDVDPDEPKCWIISPTEVRTMLNDPTLTSADYMAVKALSANGMIHNFMGFTWVLSNRLTINAGAPNSRSTLAFTKRALGLQVNQDIFVRIAERPDLSHLIQVYLEWTMGCVRVEDEHIVEAQTEEVAT